MGPLLVLKKLISGRVGIGVVFALGIVGGYLLSSLSHRQANVVQGLAPFRERDGEYEFINPLLFYEVPNDTNSREYSVLVSRIERTIDVFVQDDQERKVSVYYRDLNKGRWIGINEDENYTPSSLLKIVIMIAYFKSAESHPEKLSYWITFSKDIKNLIDLVPYAHGTSLVLNQRYTVNDLIRKMIIDSDDGAAFALLSEIHDGTLDQIYSGLGLANPGEAGREYTISPQSYASFLRILYNATYLTRAMSERALELLSHTHFHDGIAASMPRSVQVAHKYGETVSTQDGHVIDFVELHDCGIVYYPNSPYVLCVMTKGAKNDDVHDLSGVIKAISSVVYEHINSQKR